MKWVALFTLGCFCVLSSYSWARFVPAGHRPHASAAQAAPVVLTRGGHVLYDSGRAETIGRLLNVTPENADSYKRWGFK